MGLLQAGVLVWAVYAICLFRALLQHSKLQPVWLKYLLCGVAAAFGATLPILGYYTLYKFSSLPLSWLAVLLLPFLLIGGIVLLWQVGNPSPR